MRSADRFCLLLPLLIGALFVLPACTATGETARPSQGVITRAEIDTAGLSGTAFEIVRHLRPQWFNTRGVNVRGTADPIIVYIDGSRVGTAPDALRGVSGVVVDRIERLNAREATLRFGTAAGHTEGAILVSTRR